MEQLVGLYYYDYLADLMLGDRDCKELGNSLCRMRFEVDEPCPRLSKRPFP